jgi:hypothetical protein
MLSPMETLYFWRCASDVTGRRYTTRYRLSEADARSRLIAPERIDYGALAAVPITSRHAMPSGLVQRADGVFMNPTYLRGRPRTENGADPCGQAPSAGCDAERRHHMHQVLGEGGHYVSDFSAGMT